MSNIIDITSYEHLRRKRLSSGEPYTCSITGVTFPCIYKVLIPDGEEINGAPAFTGKFSAYYQLSKKPCYTNSDLPGFPASTATEINTLDKGDEFYLDLLHFKDEAKAEGFMEGCFHMGMLGESISKKKTDIGVFILLTRKNAPKKNAHILYHTSENKFIEFLKKEMPCNYVAAFNYLGEITPLRVYEDEEN